MPGYPCKEPQTLIFQDSLDPGGVCGNRTTFNSRLAYSLCGERDLCRLLGDYDIPTQRGPVSLFNVGFPSPLLSFEIVNIYLSLVIGLFGLIGMLGVCTAPFIGRAIDGFVPWMATLVSLVFYIMSQAIQTSAGELSIGAVIVATLCKRIDNLVKIYISGLMFCFQYSISVFRLAKSP